MSASALTVLEQMLGFPLSGIPLRRRLPVAWKGFATGAPSGTGHLQMLMPPCLPEHLNFSELGSKVQSLEKEWDAAVEGGDTTRAVTIAIQLTYAKTALAASAQQAPIGSNGGNPGSAGGPTGSPFRRQVTPPSCPTSPTLTAVGSQVDTSLDVAIALEMLQHLPGACQLIKPEKWIDLLQHPSQKVRVAALLFVKATDVEQAYFKEELTNVVHCLCAPDSYEAAESALRRLNASLTVQAEVLRQLRQLIELHKDQSHSPVRSPQRCSCAHSGDVRSPCGEGDSGAGGMCNGHKRRAGGAERAIGFLKFLQRQVKWCSEPELQVLSDSSVCDDLLLLSGTFPDADALNQLLAAVVDLKAAGFKVTAELAEARARAVANQIYKCLAAQRWVLHLAQVGCNVPPGMLRDYLQLPPPGPDMFEGQNSASESDAAHLVLEIAFRYIDEHIYLQKLQLLHLSILAANTAAAPAKSTRVLAAWRVLRSSDVSSQAAVLEVLESFLTSGLKPLVLPLLDTSPLENKLLVGASVCSDLQSTPDGQSGGLPQWVQECFVLPGERLGSELCLLCHAFADGLNAVLPSTPPPDALLPRLVLLSPLRLYSDLLATHVAEIAKIASFVRIAKGQHLCRHGETYVVVSGTFVVRATGRAFNRGEVIQELHAVCRELALCRVVCTSLDGAEVLRIRDEDLFELMFRLPPKFALGLLKSLIRVLPAPSQSGGSRTERAQPRGSPALSDDASQPSAEGEGGKWTKDDLTHAAAEQPWQHAVDDGEPVPNEELMKESEEDDEEEVGENIEETKALSGEPGVVQGLTHGSASRQMRSPFSTLEKVVLLQGVKIFRYVTLEYLPSIASCCVPAFFSAGKDVFRDLEPTDATLYIVADGVLGLYSHASRGPRSRSLQRCLQNGDSMGNTGLLRDHHWQYTATALEDTWLLCIGRTDLTDLLRGRESLPLQ